MSKVVQVGPIMMMRVYAFKCVKHLKTTLYSHINPINHINSNALDHPAIGAGRCNGHNKGSLTLSI